MNTTETNNHQTQLPTLVPTVRLIYEGGVGITAAAPRIIRGAFLIGREVEPSQGLRIEHDSKASRIHALIALGPQPGSLTLRDQGSRNGTMLNGQSTTDSVLRDGDLLQIGQSFLVVRLLRTAAVDADMPEILGAAPSVCELRHHIRRVAPTAVPVLILGETGVGKELAARGLHIWSGRPGSFVPINCAAIPDQLAESHLFGHVAGAFTGARGAQLGLFLQADRGTLFLDEITEMSLAHQAKLLRVLEDSAVLQVGATRATPCDVRVVAATNKDPESLLASGAFRADLYARIAGVTLRMPPLRERREDILTILQQALGQEARAIPPDLIRRLLHYAWPYNVRELRRVAERIRLYSGDDLLGDLSTVLPQEPETDSDPQGEGAMPGRAALERLLEEHHGVVAHIARAVGRSRRQVDRWLEQHGLDPRPFRR